MIAKIMGAVSRTNNGTMGSETILSVRDVAFELIVLSL
jgi:hypothetical protein